MANHQQKWGKTTPQHQETKRKQRSGASNKLMGGFYSYLNQQSAIDTAIVSQTTSYSLEGNNGLLEEILPRQTGNT